MRTKWWKIVIVSAEYPDFDRKLYIICHNWREVRHQLRELRKDRPSDTFYATRCRPMPRGSRFPSNILRIANRWIKSHSRSRASGGIL